MPLRNEYLLRLISVKSLPLLARGDLGVSPVRPAISTIAFEGCLVSPSGARDKLFYSKPLDQVLLVPIPSGPLC